MLFFIIFGTGNETYCCWKRSMLCRRGLAVSRRVWMVLMKTENRTMLRVATSLTSCVRLALFVFLSRSLNGCARLVVPLRFLFLYPNRVEKYPSEILVVITRVKRIVVAMLSLSFPFPSPSSSSSFFKTENFDSCSCAQTHGLSRRQTEILASFDRTSRLPVSMMSRCCYVSGYVRLWDGREERTPLSPGLP
jgi:hypothetical protein